MTEASPVIANADAAGGIAVPAVSTAGSSTIVGHRSARAALTWASGLLYTLVTLAVAFITTPILLRYLGPERLGAFRAASEWIGYLSLIQMGITPALGVLILRARNQASDAAGQTAAVFRSGLLLLIGIAVVTAAFGVAIAGLMPRLVPVRPSLAGELVTATLVAVMTVLFLPAQLSRMLAEAEQRGYVVNLALLAQAILAALFSVLLAWAGFGLVAQAIALLIGSAVAALLYVAPTWRWYVARPAVVVVADAEVTVGSIWRLGWPLAVSSMGYRLNMMTDSLIVGYFLGPTAVFYLFVTQRAVVLIGGQVNAIVNASWAALAERRMTGNQEAYVTGVLELTRLVVGVGLTLTGTVAAFNADFVRLWVGTEPYGGDLLSYLTAIVVVLSGLAAIYGFSLDTAGQAAARVPVSIAGALVNVGLSIWFVKLMGLPGVVLGTMVAALLSDVWVCPYQVHRLFGVSGRLIVAAVAGGIIRGLPWVILVGVAARQYHPPGWVSFSIEVVAVGTASMGYTWVAVLTPIDRVRWAERVRSQISRLRFGGHRSFKID